MSSTSLRSLVETAEKSLRTHRHPDLSGVQGRLNEILMAAGLGTTGSDRITRIGIHDGVVDVETAYGVRGCICDARFEFPVAIIEAEDPVRAAVRWGLEKKRSEALRGIEDARLSLGHWEAELGKIEGRLAAV